MRWTIERIERLEAAGVSLDDERLRPLAWARSIAMPTRAG